MAFTACYGTREFAEKAKDHPRICFICNNYQQNTVCCNYGKCSHVICGGCVVQNKSFYCGNCCENGCKGVIPLNKTRCYGSFDNAKNYRHIGNCFKCGGTELHLQWCLGTTNCPHLLCSACCKNDKKCRNCCSSEQPCSSKQDAVEEINEEMKMLPEAADLANKRVTLIVHKFIKHREVIFDEIKKRLDTLSDDDVERGFFKCKYSANPAALEFVALSIAKWGYTAKIVDDYYLQISWMSSGLVRKGAPGSDWECTKEVACIHVDKKCRVEHCVDDSDVDSESSFESYSDIDSD